MHITDLDLEDLLADPLVRLVMASDGVEEAHIRKLAERIVPHQTPTARPFGAGPPRRQAGSCGEGQRGGSVLRPCA